VNRDAAIETLELTRRFGPIEAVQPLSLTVHAGETFGILGPNGAGKTSLLSMLATLLPPSSGDARVAGYSLSREAVEVRRRVGLAPQQLALYPELSGEENALFFARLHGLTGAGARRRAAEVLEQVGLTARKRDRVREYSGGMQRRLNLACGLVHEPSVLLLDEPTVGVDPQSRDHLLETIRGLASAGTTVLYTTHYMEEAQRICDRIAILEEGRVIALGTLPELLAIVGSTPVIEVRADLEHVFMHLTGRGLRD
jgi:ABC-2 type transport system ATP-binding protein